MAILTHYTLAQVMSKNTHRHKATHLMRSNGTLPGQNIHSFFSPLLICPPIYTSPFTIFHYYA